MPGSLEQIATATPATILTGFLGSGKTTLLNHLLGHPALHQTAVLINEFGAVGIDHLLVRKLDETTVLLNSGCICCTVRDDLVSALKELYRKRLREEVPAFDRVIIETTGLADPAPIAHTFFSDLFVSSCFWLDGIVTIVDAAHASDQLGRFPESLKQVAIADRLLMSKVDVVDPECVEEVRAKLRLLNKTAPIDVVANGVVPPEQIFGIGLLSGERKVQIDQWLRSEHPNGPHHAHSAGDSHIDAYESISLVWDRPLSWALMTKALEGVISRHGDALLRVKALMNIVGEPRPFVIQGVQHLFHPPLRLAAWPSADHRSRLVAIMERGAGQSVARILQESLGGSSDATGSSVPGQRHCDVDVVG